MKTCFVVCPIGEEKSPERENSDKVIRHFIEPVCKELGFKVIRADYDATVDKINDKVIEYLEKSELVIADMSGHNPNVFYEFGYRQALKLPLIPIITKEDSIPFDVANLRTIHYVTNDIDKVDIIRDRLKETINSFDYENIEFPEPQENTFGAQSLLSIHDKLDELISLTSSRNDDEIDRITAQVAKYASPAVSEDTAMISAVLPQLLSNPTMLESLINLSERMDKNNK